MEQAVVWFSFKALVIGGLLLVLVVFPPRHVLWALAGARP
jgi:hypothetical protein